MAKLIEHMPREYKNAMTIKGITHPLDLENENQENLTIETVNQFNVNTSTYALARYEGQYGLSINPNITTDERRSRIKAKMRSIGVVNEEMIKNIVKSWTNSNVEVVYLPNYKKMSNYTNLELSAFTNLELAYFNYGKVFVASEEFEYRIIFNDKVGTPSNMQDVYDALNEIKPAHLIFSFEFKYNKWIDVSVKTWQELEAYTWKQVLDYRIF